MRGWFWLVLLGCAAQSRAPARIESTCRGKPLTEEVSFAASDGLVLHATFSNPCGGAVRAVVVLAHQMCRDRSEWKRPQANWIEEFSRRSIATLALDLRGHGASKRWPGGIEVDLCAAARDISITSPMSEVPIGAFYTRMVDDVRAAVRFVRNERKASAVALVGSSIGANSALVVASQDPNIAAVVALSPGFDYRGVRTEEPVRDLGSRPVILEAAEDDRVSASAVRQLAAVNALLRTVIWPEGGHGNSMLESRPEELASLVGFVANALENERP